MCRRRAKVATPVNGNVKLGRAAARSGEWAQHFSNASCLLLCDLLRVLFQPRERGNTRLHRIHNVQIALNFLTHKRVGRLFVIITLTINSLVCHFSINSLFFYV